MTYQEKLQGHIFLLRKEIFSIWAEDKKLSHSVLIRDAFLSYPLDKYVGIEELNRLLKTYEEN